jgi:hypothetical protein
MKRLTFIPVIALGILAAGSALASVKTDYDHSAQFERYHTFAWRTPRPTNAIVQNSLLDSRVKNDVAREMTARGLTEDRQHPDVYLVYHANAAPRHEWTQYGGWGGWRRPYWGGPGIVYNYVAESIVLDMVDARTGQLVWRAYMENTGSRLADVQSEKQVAKLVLQAFKHFPGGNRKQG